MKLSPKSALGLSVGAFCLGYGCSSPETQRSPIYAPSTLGGSVGGSTGGSVPQTGGSKAMGGTGGNSAPALGNMGGSGGSTGASGKVGGTSGGGNTGGGPSMVCSTSAGIANMLSTHGCNDCHSGQGPATFASAAHLDAIVAGAIADNECGGTVIVPGMANTSTLYLRLSGTGPATCEKMPKNNSPALSATELTCLQTWINGL